MTEKKKKRPNNTDRRVKRTKKALRDALFELLDDKTINQITVTELTTLADVNRATFYFYYKDLNDMLRQIQEEAFNFFRDELGKSTTDVTTVEGLTEYIKKYLNCCKEHETICRFILNNEANAQLNIRIQEFMIDNIPDTKEIFAEDDPARYSTNFAVVAVMGILVDWMNEGMKCPVHNLAEYLAKLFLEGYHKAKPI